MRITIIILIVYLLSFILPSLFGHKTASYIPFIVGFLGLLYHFLFRRDEPVSKMGFIVGGHSYYLEAILMVSVVLGLTLAIGWMSGGLKLGKEMTSTDWLKLAVNIPISAIILGTIATFTEELFFRGVVQKELYETYSPFYAIVFASFIFGLWHLPFGIFYKLKGWEILLYVIGTSLVGLIFGGLYYKSKSLLVAGLAHGMWNAIVYALYGLGNELPGLLAGKNETVTHPEYGIIGVVVLLLVIVIRSVI
ncbi:MAG: CPBP family intramembrane metalloprotease [Proteobacteria bacterium]|nr:CPBP family intramembrane metalloprotease [Pseudomonadota bacterium]